MKKIILLLLAFVFYLSPVFAASWVKYDEKTYIDKDSVAYYTKDNGEVVFNQKEVWIKWLNDKSKYFQDLEKIDNKKIWYCMQKFVFNYNTHMLSVKDVVVYDLEGKVITSNTYPDYALSWSSIIPETRGEEWAELVKSPRKLNKLYKMQQLENLELIEE